MPDGLRYLLSAPGKKKFAFILENEGTSLFNAEYVQELVKNFTNENKRLPLPKKHILHLLLYVLPKEELFYDDKLACVYDSFELHIDEIFKQIFENFKKYSPESSHILIIDDFSMFSLLSSSRNCASVGRFLRACSRKFFRSFVFANQLTLTTCEISKVYEVASAVAILGGGENVATKTFSCDLLKIREERRVSHEQTRFQVTNDGVVDVNVEVGIPANTSQEDVLKNLTTFKLTVEDNEKESRSKLYLPYFDAQKIVIEDTEDMDEYDDEDEEV